MPSVQDQASDTVRLSPEQVAFYQAFGFVRLPGLVADQIDRISNAFDEVFETTDDILETTEAVHKGERRLIIMGFIDRHPDLAWLSTDPRVNGVAESLLGPDFTALSSDGNLLWCDTLWHCDIYQSPLEIHHLKLFFYLDPLRDGAGSLRVIPGTNHWDETYSHDLRHDLMRNEAWIERFDLPWEEIPSYVIDTEPGDVIAGAFRTLHGTVGGAPGRRLFTLNYREGEGNGAARGVEGWDEYAREAAERRAAITSSSAESTE